MSSTKDSLAYTIPFYVHMDEGRGLRKTAVQIISAQAVFGLETSERFQLAFRNGHGRETSDIEDYMAESQDHNSKGSTYKSRFLHSCVPKKWYSGKHQNMYSKLLEDVAAESKALFEKGIYCSGQQYFLVCLGLKADAPALAKAGSLNRSFLNLGFQIPCCWQCMAGAADIPWEDVRKRPVWEPTIHLQEPWGQNTGSPLLAIPGRLTCREAIYHQDPFHTYKQSIGGHFIASSIIALMEMDAWPGDLNSMDILFDRAYQDFNFFVKHEFPGRQVAHIKKFTRAMFHFPRDQTFPYARWKGADIMLAHRWLCQVLVVGAVLDVNQGRVGPGLLWSQRSASELAFFEEIHRGATTALEFWQILRKNGIWLRPESAKRMAEVCYQFCQSYTKLARMSIQANRCRFQMQPSLHYYAHYYVRLWREVETGCKWVASPALENCEADEDFIGRVARVSRRVHNNSVPSRTVERSLIKYFFVLNEVDS